MKRIVLRFRSAAFASLILAVLVSACAPAQVTVLTATTGIPAAAETTVPSETPRPTETPIPLTATSTATPEPTASPTATPEPGPAISTYLPQRADLPECLWILITEEGSSAQTWCGLKGNHNLTTHVELLEKPMDGSGLGQFQDWTALEAPEIGEAAGLFTDAAGKAARLQFARGNWSVTVHLFNPVGKVKTDDAVRYAQLVDTFLPAQALMPGPIDFPETENVENLSKYFRKVTLSVQGRSPQAETSEMAEEDSLCLTIVPVRLGRDPWSVAVYDVQKQRIIKKQTFEMQNTQNCGGFQPRYAAGDFKAGDTYELRIAAGEDWVATLPLVTK